MQDNENKGGQSKGGNLKSGKQRTVHLGEHGNKDAEERRRRGGKGKHSRDMLRKPCPGTKALTA